MKNRQENIIKILKNNISVNIINNLRKLKDIEINLKQKMDECERRKRYWKNEITINSRRTNKKLIENNLELHANSKNQKL